VIGPGVPLVYVPWCVQALLELHAREHRVKSNRLAAILALGAILILASAPASVLAASSSVECGQISAYTAPDPVAPADGSLSIGFLPAWTIAADATLSPAVQANLASIVNSAPSCLTMDLDVGGVVTALDFASTGDISGAVVFDSGLSGYVFADRLLVPTFITDAYPGLAGVFVTSADAGTNASAKFLVDTSSGLFTGLSAAADFCGPGDLAGNGDGLVGAATIPAVLLDADDTDALAGADLRQACATVSVEGTIDFANEGQLTLTSAVTIAVAPPPPATSTINPAASRSEAPSPVGLAGLLALAVLLLASRSVRAARETTA
jgi:hypothetical protein